MWERLRKYVFFWIGVLVLLVAAALITYWDEIVQALSQEFSSALASVITIAIMVWVIISMIRSLFR